MNSARPDNKNAILAIILISYVMIVLDISIVITGLPKIKQELGFSDAGLSWISNAYTLTFGGFLLLGARAGDILGRRRMFVTGLAVFVLSSLAIGLVQSPAWLIAARAVQGLGSAILAPSTLALLQTVFTAGPERNRAIALYASASGVSASIGLLLGGILADWVSWRAGFFINFPIGMAMIWAAGRYIPETEKHRGKFDLAGALGSTLGMTALVFGIVQSAISGWGHALTLQALALGVFLLVAFVWIEQRATQPIMPLRLFASQERSGAYLVRILFLGANVGFFFFATQYMQGVRGFGPALTGLAFLPSMLANFMVALSVPRLIRRLGAGTLLLGSITLGLAGMLWLSQVGIDTGYLDGLLLPMLLIGIGQGGAMAPLTMSGVVNVAPQDAGAASGLVNAAHQLGCALGLGVQVAAAALGGGALKGSGLLTHQVANAMAAASVMLLLALILAFFMIIRPRMQQALTAGLSADRP
jgi:MFS family permease